MVDFIITGTIVCIVLLIVEKLVGKIIDKIKWKDNYGRKRNSLWTGWQLYQICFGRNVNQQA